MGSGLIMNVIPYTLVMLIILGLAAGDIEKDKEKCGNQVVGMATCLPYVSGESKSGPPMDCCAGFKQVLQKSPECICLPVNDRNDPSLGLKINATLALGLPTVCKAPANGTINDCPALLHQPPNSPDAKVFYDFANSAKKNNATAPASGNASSSSAGVKSDGGRRKSWSGRGMDLGVLLAMAAVQALPNL